MSRIHGKSRTFEAEIAKKAEEEGVARGVGNALLGRTPFEDNALKQFSYATDAQAVGTQIARNPATQYLVLNSKDRNQTSTVASPTYSRQPWNRFKLQRPQNLMNTYATRMLVSEINFPMYVPNVNQNNNKFWYQSLSNTTAAETLWEIELFSGFYSQNAAGVNLGDVITALLASSGGTTYGTITPLIGSGYPVTPATVVANTDNSFRWVSGGQAFALFFFRPLSLIPVVPPPPSDYYSNPSLLLLMGMGYEQVSGQSILYGVNGNPTTLQYTQYIDIVSDKLHQYSTNRDGSSDNTFGRNLICRLYVSDEASNVVEGALVESAGGAGPIISIPVQFVPGVSGPFIIHRQFKNPKAVMWNKEASVDWIDISLYDEYGNLIPLPPNLGAEGFIPLADPAYPDFQITFLASEN